MPRPRELTSDECPECTRADWKNPDNRAAQAEHRIEHRRRDRRREQWRRANDRRRMADGRIGSLHDLRCKGPSYCTCHAIPVYSSAEVAA